MFILTKDSKMQNALQARKQFVIELQDLTQSAQLLQHLDHWFQPNFNSSILVTSKMKTFSTDSSIHHLNRSKATQELCLDLCINSLTSTISLSSRIPVTSLQQNRYQEKLLFGAEAKEKDQCLNLKMNRISIMAGNNSNLNTLSLIKSILDQR